MTFASGIRIGPYHIVGLLGAGGMGEVYRVRDTRLEREVAIKVLPKALSGDADRLRRFQQEAQAAGALNHPNILAIYDVGAHEGSPYIVCELLEGESLRDRMAGGPLPARKVIDYAQQTTRGLAAAHQKGIVHRDLKPDNLFLTTDGRVKILDFGLAKLTHSPQPAADSTSAPTMAIETQPGVVLGTVGYMSPEQVRGQPADHRSDIFSLGVILYEMLTGQRAFRGDSAVETMNAILKEDPPEFTSTVGGLSRIIQRCLEKNPNERFQSASDLGFALESATGLSGAMPQVAAAPPRRKRVRVAALAAGALLAGLGAGLAIGLRPANREPPVFHQVTFRRGSIQTARFAPDGETIVYGAAWEGRPVELFSTRRGSSESRPLGLGNAEILSISSTGEMAILLNARDLAPMLRTGTLARVPLAGGAPREVLEDVLDADWTPNGRELLAARFANGRSRIEFPIGKTLYETPGNIWRVRFSPKGDRIAFFERPVGMGGEWTLAVIDLAGKKTTTSRWFIVWGLAWSSSGDEIWFSASQKLTDTALYAVTLGGRQRLLERVPDPLAIRDISRDGQVLVIRQSFREAMVGVAPGEARERDLSWLGISMVTDVSADGNAVVLLAPDPEGIETYSVYLRKTDGSPAIRLGGAQAPVAALSPDGRWVATFRRKPSAQLVLLPTRAGVPQELALDPVEDFMSVGWFADGQRILLTGAERGRAPRLYVWDLAARKMSPTAPEAAGVMGCCVSPDGQLVAAVGPDGGIRLLPVGGGPPRPIAGALPGDVPIRWSSDGRVLYVSRPGELPMKVFRLDATGSHRSLWKELALSDPAGVYPGFAFVVLTPDAKSYFYSYSRLLSELYLVEGLRP